MMTDGARHLPREPHGKYRVLLAELNKTNGWTHYGIPRSIGRRSCDWANRAARSYATIRRASVRAEKKSWRVAQSGLEWLRPR